ncbi:Phosducin-like protein 2 [Blyttiomyces sp. JEL0837]|nr:Phosducin-like protein 2 [Blyttiomyces sp. JEL0837]
MNADEQILRAFQGQSDYDDYDPPRGDDEEDTGNFEQSSNHNHNHTNSNNQQDSDAHNPFANDPNANNETVSRILEDQQIRQQLGIGGAMTGPKGVIADYKFHARQEQLRATEKSATQLAKLSAKVLPSGWLQRQLEAEKVSGINGSKSQSERELEDDEDDADALIRALDDEEESEATREYKAKRILHLARLSLRPTFGSVKEIEVNEYVKNIESEDSEVTVIIHLYQPYHDACRLTNAFLNELAIRYPLVKFLKIVATKAERNYDEVALPTLICYKGGEMLRSLVRITDMIDNWGETGRCDIEDFEQFLFKQGVLTEEDCS